MNYKGCFCPIADRQINMLSPTNDAAALQSKYTIAGSWLRLVIGRALGIVRRGK